MNVLNLAWHGIVISAFSSITVPLHLEPKYIEPFPDDRIKASATLDIAPLGRSLPPTQAHCRALFQMTASPQVRGKTRCDRIDRPKREEGFLLSGREKNEPEFLKSDI